jgi:N-acetylmuramoyl-L-alanine amidase
MLLNTMLKKGILIFGGLLLIGALKNQTAAQAKKLKTIIVDAGHGGSDPGARSVYDNNLGSLEKNITLAISLKLVAELKKKLPDINVVPTRTTDVFDPPGEKARIANEAKGDLFICIHADSQNPKKGRRLVGTKTVTRYKVYYTGKGRRREKHSEPYDVEIPEYENYIMPGTANGTSVYIFAAHKTSDKLKAIMDGQEEMKLEDGDSTEFNYKSPEFRQLAQIYAKVYQEKSDLLATLVNDEVEATGRKALGVNQRQVGIRVLSATKMPAILVETGFLNNPEDEQYLQSNKGQQELSEAITKAVIKYRNRIENPKPATTGK